ncbi:MAG: hypothetical protein GX125_01425 [Bacteroidales bacterium]|jgi:hypothetical protein|nr:hypothetical protein [Bacteroidota bacterium]NLN98920.1 hypothetical protein [Bacteroidales bacterium]
MKQLEDIEKLSAEDLERISADESILVPKGIGRDLRTALAAAAFAEEAAAQRRRNRIRYILLAGAAAVVTAVLLLPSNTPQDTFDDPKLAYAELERTFSYISRKMDTGIAMTGKFNESIETVNNAINKIK